MTRTFSYAFPGSIYEVSPDYGMITQAWNIYSYAIPIVQQFFGIQPIAQQKKIIIKPQMPSSWEEGASLENVKVGDNSVSIFYANERIEVQQTNSTWIIQLELPRDMYKITEGEAETTSKGSKSIFKSTGETLIVGKNK